ncbi:Palmitoyltransferase AKR1 [Pichia kudriavzevii]|uniref:Palmitoyltransferase n=1 Tax=Pichia kudriavzevii TaxID=4909 RepID=A0A1V2LFF3_PICKU|nr:Palmitoyltransferase AKR1 [Pichia kudriavzevii]
MAETSPEPLSLSTDNQAPLVDPNPENPNTDSPTSPSTQHSLQSFTSIDAIPEPKTSASIDSSILQEIVSASQHGNITVLRHYLDPSNTSPISANITDSNGITLVHWAALNNRLEALKYLVSIGADADIPAGDMGATPLLWAVRYGLVYIADYLIRETNADVHIKDKNGIGILMAAVFSSNVMMVVYILWTLSYKPQDIDITDPSGRTSLHWAAYQGDFLTVDVLLLAGAKVDIQDSEGFTPLHWGLVNGSKAVLTSLINAKSDITLKTGNEKTCWDIAADMKNSSTWATVSLKLVLVPSLELSKPSLLKTPLFAGYFSATAYWCIVTWLFKVLPNTYANNPFENIVFFFGAFLTMLTFFKAMNMDPGFIPQETDPGTISQTIFQLLKERKFDSLNYCIYTNIRKPLFSKYSKDKKLNVARFDHYCPWVNNDIGIRNHKFSKVHNHNHSTPETSFSSVPADEFNKAKDQERQQDTSTIGLNGHVDDNAIDSGDENLAIPQCACLSSLSRGTSSGIFASRFIALPITLASRIMSSKFCKMVGLEQVMVLTTDLVNHEKDISQQNKLDFGLKTNWLDFLFLRRTGDEYSFRTLTALPINGEGNLNGRLVDYYTLFTLPEFV